MLKPRKCSKAMVVLSPRISIVVGKKLLRQHPEIVKMEFQYFRACVDSGNPAQCSMVGRALGGWYMRFMKKNYPGAETPLHFGEMVLDDAFVERRVNLSMKAEYHHSSFMLNKTKKHYVPLVPEKEIDGVRLVGK
ncbi:hypothetical protein MLDJOKPK_00015 [Salmonella phage SPAsTU]|nr:hypothetical protein MLDJOKPK_00015 [Salmonella phage SPAsTU]